MSLSLLAGLRSRTSVTCKSCRSIFTSAVRDGKRNFRKFELQNKRGSKEFRLKRNAGEYPDIPIETKVRPIGYKIGDKFVQVPEMMSELVVPDLEGFTLKPYVSYRVPDVIQTEFTSQDLFDAVYSKKIVQDFKEGKLTEDGQPLEPSPEEKLTSEEAFQRARKTGSDIFMQEWDDNPKKSFI
ncbi:large ribosomal subunit protein mL41 [Neocloeon triangulifer]|uniref:large ribosomal subunit protein mL41 n=1 Tax=Neocloeon triangulifer TaxID=2078957 RepID=UPI00286F8380|nr:large ribosomal subunit protein mL41 [Neocloeon triangulifer]